MADELNEVQPGDLITADLMNALIRAVKGLATGPGGTVLAPNLIGRQLKDAKAVLALPGTQLNLGAVIDAFGLVVNPNDSANQLRLVISQAPPSGGLAFPGSSVNLVLAAVPTTGATPTPPTISQIVRSGSSPLDPNIPAGTEMQIIGSGFDASPGNNVVRINGVQLPQPSSGTTRFVIYAMVPTTGIPGFPPTDALQVDVTVQTPTGGTSAIAHATILPPLPQPTPQIGNITPNPARLGQSMTIAGTNLISGDLLAQVLFSVSLGGAPIVATPSIANPTSLTVTVPEIPAVRNSDFPVTIQIQVKIDGLVSPAFPHFIST